MIALIMETSTDEVFAMHMDRFNNSSPTGRVYSSGGETFGVKTGGSRRCGLEGCRGRKIGVRWPNGELTYPCTDGLVSHPSGASQIG